MHTREHVGMPTPHEVDQQALLACSLPKGHAWKEVVQGSAGHGLPRVRGGAVGLQGCFRTGLNPAVLQAAVARKVVKI